MSDDLHIADMYTFLDDDQPVMRGPIGPDGICPTCGGKGMIGGHTGQTAESYDEWSEACPDCGPDYPPFIVQDGNEP